MQQSAQLLMSNFLEILFTKVKKSVHFLLISSQNKRGQRVLGHSVYYTPVLMVRYESWYSEKESWCTEMITSVSNVTHNPVIKDGVTTVIEKHFRSILTVWLSRGRARQFTASLSAMD